MKEKGTVLQNGNIQSVAYVLGANSYVAVRTDFRNKVAIALKMNSNRIEVKTSQDKSSQVISVKVSLATSKYDKCS